jgi:hypothetical protein
VIRPAGGGKLIAELPRTASTWSRSSLYRWRSVVLLE